MSGRLDGKVAIITGGAQGIGAGIVEAFLREGARVVIGDQKDAGTGDSENTRFVQLDVASPEGWETIVKTCLDAFGTPDILVNNAGISSVASSMEDESLDDFNRVIAVNLAGPFLGAKAVVPLMRENGGGAIVNIASVFADRSVGFAAGYTSSKGGVAALTRYLAAAYATDKIRVNAINPGNMRTALTTTPDGKPTSEVQLVIDRTPMGRQGEPDEIAGACVYLASDEASYTTGVSLPVDGGFCL